MPPNDERVSDTARGRTRLIVFGLAALLVVTLGLWSYALVTASRAAPPILLVFGPSVVAPNAPIPLRVVAMDASGRKVRPFVGTIRSPTTSAPVAGSNGAIVSGPNEGNETIRVEGTSLKTKISVDFTVQTAGASTEPAPLLFRPWTDELRRPHAQAVAAPAVYPDSGRVSSAFPGQLVVVDEGIRIRPQPANALRVITDDGRPLRLDRTGIRVDLAPVLAPSAVSLVGRISVDTVGAVFVDILQDGNVIDTKSWAPKGEGDFSFSIPAAPAGTLWTVHASDSPFARKRGAVAHAVVGDESDLIALVGRAGGNLDPLYLALKPRGAGEGNSGATAGERMLMHRALLSRVHLASVRAPLLGPSADAQRKVVKADRKKALVDARGPFRAAASAFAIAVFFVAVVPASRARRRQKALMESEDEAPTVTRWSSRAFAFFALIAALGLLAVLDWVLAHADPSGM